MEAVKTVLNNHGVLTMDFAPATKKQRGSMTKEEKIVIARNRAQTAYQAMKPFELKAPIIQKAVESFNDMMGKGYPKFGDCPEPEHFKELLKSFISHYHEEARMPVDLLGEVRPDSYQSLAPGKKYSVRTPSNMPR